ncbi:MAG: FliH/SctL family protein [Desulfobacter sp.]
MSLSDDEKNNRPDDDGFTPIDVRSLDSFEEEKSQKTEDSEPDFDRFKLLFDPSAFEEEDVTFEALYSLKKDMEEEPFEPLIEGTGEDQPPPAPEEDDSGEVEEDEEPEPTPEEIGFEQGFQKGLEQGRETGEAEGKAKGLEQGLAKGEAEGFAKGEAEGFAKGEAEGLEQGRQQGREEAEAEVREQVAGILDPLKESLETADDLLERLLKRYEVQILDLVFKIVEKAVGAKLDTDEEIVKHTVLDALQHLVAPEEITLSISNDDYEYVEMVKEEFFEAVRSLKHIAVTSDPMIPRGGCRIESTAATIATDPESKLAAVYDAIARTER